jgi:hypothetical protein
MSVDLAWAAGFYDGEGSFGIYVYERDGYSHRHTRLTVGQSGDCRTLERFRDAVGVGKIVGPYKFKHYPGSKPHYTYKVQRYTDAIAVLKKLWPYMSEPKREQVLAAEPNFLKVEAQQGGRVIDANDLHVDLVGHDWHNFREYLVERRPADEPNAGKSGDYAHYSQPHTMAECPFAEQGKGAA